MVSWRSRSCRRPVLLKTTTLQRLLTFSEVSFLSSRVLRKRAYFLRTRLLRKLTSENLRFISQNSDRKRRFWVPRTQIRSQNSDRKERSYGTFTESKIVNLYRTSVISTMLYVCSVRYAPFARYGFSFSGQSKRRLL